ncbi:MAG: hypothetical protein O3A84_11035, partial [Proteobacteria bacterium]|nr:hypothetical protein [Pseudomonadota bacterium]
MSDEPEDVSASKESDTEITDIDRDSLHTLSLAFLPLQNNGIRSARLIKNAELDSVVEMFREKETGSGQVTIETLPQVFGWPPDAPFPDLPLLTKLSELLSYDVYSLRIALRDLGIDVNKEKFLKLSDAKTEELTAYMKAFTEPLIRQVYGGTDVSVSGYDDLIGLFRNADIEDARKNLQAIADRLKIPLAGVPKFLEDFGDIFLALSYYKQCLRDIEPRQHSLLESLRELRETRMFHDDKTLMQACDDVEGNMERMHRALEARMEEFESRTANLWDNLSAEMFRHVQTLVTRNHVVVGGALCTLAVKVDAWT